MHSIFDSQTVIYRDDLQHDTVSGNKLHKLGPNLTSALAANRQGIASFGGPFSNHLHALAWACKSHNLESIGIVRGELHDQLTPTLNDCKSWGMRLVPLNRADYRECQGYLSGIESTVCSHDSLPTVFPHLPDNFQLIPEGGSNAIAVESLAKAYAPIFRKTEFSGITHALCATGTGATIAGLRKAAPVNVEVIGIQAVAEGDATLRRIQQWLGASHALPKVIDGHMGGFAKTPEDLLRFIQRFESRYNTPLDPIYNGKVIYKLNQLAEQNYFSVHDKILVIHTGGLQGKRGIQTD